MLKKMLSADGLKKYVMTSMNFYMLWYQMKQRCEKEGSHAYHHYGGRGIKVCAEWHTLDNFRDWALKSGYELGLSIERVDVNGDYSPENCIWIPRSVQNLNRRDTLYVEYKGDKVQLSVFAKRHGIGYHTAKYWYYAGMSTENMLARQEEINQGVKLRRGLSKIYSMQ